MNESSCSECLSSDLTILVPWRTSKHLINISQLQTWILRYMEYGVKRSSSLQSHPSSYTFFSPPHHFRASLPQMCSLLELWVDMDAHYAQIHSMFIGSKQKEENA